MRGDGVQASEGAHLPKSLQGHHTEDVVSGCVPGFVDQGSVLRFAGECECNRNLFLGGIGGLVMMIHDVGVIQN